MSNYQIYYQKFVERVSVEFVSGCDQLYTVCLFQPVRVFARMSLFLAVTSCILCVCFSLYVCLLG